MFKKENKRRQRTTGPVQENRKGWRDAGGCSSRARPARLALTAAYR